MGRRMQDEVIGKSMMDLQFAL